MGVDIWVSMGSTMPRAVWGPCMACSWGIGPFWGPMDLQFVPGTILVAWDAIAGLVVCFLVCDVWSNTSIIQHTNTLATTFINYGIGLLMELGFCSPIEFNILT
jgi:hypothetical protein